MPILNGKYGPYYAYTDNMGKKCGIKITNDVNKKYIEPGHLTEEDLDLMLGGKEKTFTVDSLTLTAKIIPYTTKDGRDTKIISITSNEDTDLETIKSDLQKIASSYYNGRTFDYHRPQEVVYELPLVKNWRTFTQTDLRIPKNNKYQYAKLNIYYKRDEAGVNAFLEIDTEENKTVILSDEDEYEKRITDTIKANEELAKQKEETRKKINEQCEALIDKLVELDELASGARAQIIKNLHDVVDGVEVPNIESLVISMLKSSWSPTITDLFSTLKAKVEGHQKYGTTYSEDFAKEILQSAYEKLKVYYEYLSLKSVRLDLHNKIKSEGLEKVTECVNIDDILDLGYFRSVQKALVGAKTQHVAIKHIINNMYLDVTNKDELLTKLLNMLKVYYAFYDFPEKDRQSLAKFIAKNNLSEYYEQVKKYDDMLETLIDVSRDPKLLKPILNSIAGTSRADFLKDKTFYFERKANLKNDVVYKPVELLEKLKDCIKEFNVSSNVAILTNVELGADESFTFCFYTFSGDGGEDFDGRRIQYMTKIYNMKNPTQRIGFVYD